MTLQSSIRKIYFGVADRRQMFRLFDRHAQRPNRWENVDGVLFAGEWFEIAPADARPPAAALDARGNVRHALLPHLLHLAQPRSPVEIRDAIVERECWPVKAMTHDERLEHVWSATHDEYRGYAGDRFLAQHRGKRTVLV